MNQQQMEALPWDQYAEQFETLPEAEQQKCIRTEEYLKALYETADEIQIYEEDVEDEEWEAHRALALQIAKYYLVLPENIHECKKESSPQDNLNTLLQKDAPLTDMLIATAIVMDQMTANRRVEKAFDVGYAEMAAWLNQQEEAHEELERVSEIRLIHEFGRNRLARVFRKHQDETQNVVCREPLIKRRNNRPMGLEYRPVTASDTEQITAIEVKPVFYWRKEPHEFEEMRQALQKEKAIPQIWSYFLYEASDFLERIRAYQIKNITLQIPILNGAINVAKTGTAFGTWLKESEVDVRQVVFSLEEEQLAKPGKAFQANLEKIKKAGIPLAVREYTGKILDQEKMEAFGIHQIILAESVMDHIDQDTKDNIAALIKAGYKVQADGIADDSLIETLKALQVQAISGSLAGEYTSEQEMLDVILKQ